MVDVVATFLGLSGAHCRGLQHPVGMSIHEGHIRDVGRLVRVESGDLRCHPLAAVELESGSASGRDSVTR
jgi:hypothetical protein